MKGYADRLARGGAGVTYRELQSYQEFGKKVVQRALESRVGPECERISRLVEYAGVDPQLIFTGRFAPEPPQAQEQGLPRAAPQAQPRAADSPGFASLAAALAGPRTQARAPAPARAQAHAAAGVAPTPAYSLPKQRVKDYAILKPDALKRQVARMVEKLAVNPDAYSQEEIDAAKNAYDRAFPGR